MGSLNTDWEHQVYEGWSGDTGFDKQWPDYSPYAEPDGEENESLPTAETEEAAR